MSPGYRTRLLCGTQLGLVRRESYWGDRMSGNGLLLAEEIANPARRFGAIPHLPCSRSSRLAFDVPLSPPPPMQERDLTSLLFRTLLPAGELTRKLTLMQGGNPHTGPHARSDLRRRRRRRTCGRSATSISRPPRQYYTDGSDGVKMVCWELSREFHGREFHRVESRLRTHHEPDRLK